MGGLQNHAQAFNRHLSARGYAITVFTPRLPTIAPERESESPAVSVIRYPAFELIPNWPLPQAWRPTFWKQLTALYRMPVDLVIGRTRFFASTWLACLFARLRGCPYVHIEHGADYVQFRSPLAQRLGKTLDHTLGRGVIRAADCVVANSHQTAAFIGKLAPDVAVEVIYRGVDTSALAAIPPADVPASRPPKSRLGYFGRFIAGKGIADLLASSAALPQHAIEVLVVGDGPDLAHVASLITQWQLAATVTLIQNTDWKRAIALLKTCDIIVNPSYTEGLPTVVIEAALCRKAIIATDVGGTREIIRPYSSGLLVPPRNVPALTAALKELITDPQRRQQLGEQAYRDVAGKFDWSRAIDAYHDIFSKLIA